MYSDTDILFTKEEKILRIKDLISDWDYLLALRLINELLEQDDQSSMIYYLKAYIYDIRYAEPQKAEEYYRQALLLDPENVEAFYYYLCLLNKCKRADLVLKQLDSKKGTDCRQFHDQITLQRILALELSNRLNEAKSLAEEILYSSIDDEFIEEVEQVINRITKKLERKANQSVNKAFYDLKIV